MSDRPFPRERIAPGCWRTRLGTPETAVPTAFRNAPIRTGSLGELPAAAEEDLPPLVEYRTSPRGTYLKIALSQGEQIFGLGLQLKSVNQTGRKKTLRVNSDPSADLGDAHAPVPFFVSTAGYGVLIDTARYATFYVGTHEPPPREARRLRAEPATGSTTEEVYAARETAEPSVMIEIPIAQGVDVYWFGGPGLRTALQRYNLFSGGGCLPPLAGLGFWYRTSSQANQDEVIASARALREKDIPCDIIGPEPSWLSHAYSCSFQWSSRFAEPERFLREARELNFRVNLWEHAYVNPGAPFFDEVKAKAGDVGVWNGLVPDLADPAVRQLYTDYHAAHFVAKGVAGFKLDECDNSDFNPTPWSFPELSRFPSGLDGEQMHSLFGLLYQQSIQGAFRKLNRRTYGEVRNSHALAAPLPYVLYSDLYDHRDFVRGLLTAGVSGLLWCPEVRQCSSPEELQRRMQSVMLSPQALVNGWMIRMPPWKQVDLDRNNAGEVAPYAAELEHACRELIRLRMSLIPYLYASFAQYWRTGLPPFRPLVVDHPGDPGVYKLDDQFLVGPSLLVAPAFVGQTERKIYFPAGKWHCFWTGEMLEGPAEFTVKAPIERLPIFVRDNTLLPLARPLPSCGDDAVFDLDVRVYGTNPEPFTLWEDDGVSFNFESGAYTEAMLRWQNGQGSIERRGPFPQPRHQVREWRPMSS